MTPHYEDATVTLHHGDCLDVLRELPDASVESVVCDPPYNLSFMGRQWDSHATPVAFQAWCALWTAECLRVLKPGGHLLAFGGTRTWHRLACAVEDAGFEVRDSIAWLYGSGFPKSLRVSRDERFCHCDGHAGTSSRTSPAPPLDDHTRTQDDAGAAEHGGRSAHHVTRTALDSLADCRGERGSDGEPLRPEPADARSSLPSLEDARGRSRSVVPADGPDAGSSRSPSQAQRNGHPSSQGYLSRSDAPSSPHGDTDSSSTEPLRTGLGSGSPASGTSHMGESLSAWPNCLTCGKPQANELGTALKPAFEPVVVARKPLTGTVASNVLAHGTGALNIDGCRIEGVVPQVTQGAEDRIYGNGKGLRSEPMLSQPHAAGRWPANVVLDESQAAALDLMSGTLTSGANPARRGVDGDRTAYGDFAGQEDANPQRGADSGGASRFFYTAKAASEERVRVDGIAHPTVKPLSLMRWLVRLVTPPGGTVLEPFAGSGTTVEACILEGFHCVAIEREADYLPLIVQRINRRRDPVAAVKAQGEDGGLFDLLDGGAA
jgi:hypothetical protein